MPRVNRFTAGAGRRAYSGGITRGSVPDPEGDGAMRRQIRRLAFLVAATGLGLFPLAAQVAEAGRRMP